MVCHNDQALTGNVSLQGFDVDRAAEKAATAERMIRKLRAGMIPPPGAPRPAGDILLALVEALEAVVDKVAGLLRSWASAAFSGSAGPNTSA